MKLFRYGPVGAERPAVRHKGQDFDARPVTADYTGDFFARDGLEELSSALERGSLPTVDTAGRRIAAPIARPPAVLCIGQNYAAHAAESGAAPPELPVIFYKHPGCVVGPHDDVLLPTGSRHTDWEVELAVVLKKTPRNLEDPTEAADYIAGYTISDDVSERRFQTELSGGQWSKGKSAPTFNPLGPFLVTGDAVDPGSLALKSWVNGQPRQDSSTKDMIFNVGELITHLSRHVLMMPGDVINTGTPEGVALSGRFPYLSSGDVVEIEIEGLGRQRHHVVSGR